MKKTYEKAEIKIIELSSEDIVRTSNRTPFAPYDGEEE